MGRDEQIDVTRVPDKTVVASDRPMPMLCLMCGGAQHRAVFTEFDIDILRCRTCGHVFSSFRADPHYAGFWGDEVAADEHFYWSKARARMYRDFFERFIAGRSGRLLDMGSGLGFFLKAMTQYQNWEAWGCEISPAAVRFSRERLGLDKVTCSPLQGADLPRASFDIITMWDVIDHLAKPDPLLRHCHALLEPDGILFMRTPNVTVQLLRARLMKALRGRRPDRKYLQPTDHPHHYSMRTLTGLLQRNGFADPTFIHLHPVETGEGQRATVVNAAKSLCFQAVRALAVGSAGRLNLDNLFVVARKGAAVPPA